MLFVGFERALDLSGVDSRHLALIGILDDWTFVSLFDACWMSVAYNVVMIKCKYLV